jgi:hypothetical protein
MFKSMVALSVLCGMLGSVAVAAKLHPLGYVSEDLGKVAPGREAKGVPVAVGAKSFRDMPRVDLTDEMPPVGNQGGQGSCASWSIAYYHRTQLEYRERRWDLTDPNHQFSPAFAYNQVNGGGDNGSGFENNMGLICDQGCASLADSPYNDADCTTWPSESAYARAIPFRAREWAWFRTSDTTGVNTIKQLLANGSTSCLAIRVYGNFDAIGSYHNMYCAADKIGSNRGGHLVTFVGYDDTLTTHDGTGAFRMVNSWGPAWGEQGYFWMSYEAVMDGDLSQQSAAFMTDTVGYEPKLLARVKIEHPTRDRIGIEFTVGERWSALWIKGFRSWRHAQTDQPFPNSKMVFDLTDAAPFITGGQTDSAYLCTWDSRSDGRTGTVLSSSLQYLDWGTILASNSTPVAIPDNGDIVVAGHWIRELDNDVAVARVVGPSGIVGPDSSYTPSVEVWNWGKNPATFPVVLAIGSGYADTALVDGLEPCRAETLEFAAWVAPARCTVQVRCSTGLGADEYAENDTCSTQAWSRYRDLALTAIVIPGDTVDSGAIVRPRVRVRNYGTQAETFRATFTVVDEGYSRALQATIPMLAETAFSFATWTPKTRGTYAMKCTLNMTGDPDPTNDTVSGFVTVGPPAGVAESGVVPGEFALYSPKPSMFARSAELGFSLPRAANMSLAVYDATGALIRQLRRGGTAAGTYRLTWDGRDAQGRAVPAGAYFCRLEADEQRAAARLLKL